MKRPYYKTSSKGYYLSQRVNGKVKLTHLLTCEKSPENYERACLIMKEKCWDFDPKIGTQNTLFAFGSLFIESCAANRKWCVPLIGGFLAMWKKLLVQDVKAYHVTRWLAAHPEWKSGNTQQRNVDAIKLWFNWGFKQGLLKENPIAGIVVETAKVSRRPASFMISEEEYQQLYAVAGAEGKRILKVLWLTGMRPHEIRRVKKDNYQPAQKAWVFADGQTKTPGRVVYLVPELVDLTEQMIERGREFLFYNPLHKKPWREQDKREFNFWFYKLMKKAGLRGHQIGMGGELSPYSFRHKFITDALIAGLNTYSVAKLVGTSVEMIEKHYGHLVQPETMVAMMVKVRG